MDPQRVDMYPQSPHLLCLKEGMLEHADDLWVIHGTHLPVHRYLRWRGLWHVPSPRLWDPLLPIPFHNTGECALVICSHILLCNSDVLLNAYSAKASTLLHSLHVCL